MSTKLLSILLTLFHPPMLIAVTHILCSSALCFLTFGDSELCLSVWLNGTVRLVHLCAFSVATSSSDYIVSIMHWKESAWKRRWFNFRYWSCIWINRERPRQDSVRLVSAWAWIRIGNFSGTRQKRCRLNELARYTVLEKLMVAGVNISCGM